MANMFIRQTRTNNKATGEGYFTFRLVRGERMGGKVRQITVLNLGRHFPIAQDDWALLCSRLEQLLNPQTLLCTLECSDKIERAAQHYYKQLVDRATLAHSDEVAPTPAAVPTPAATPAPTASLAHQRPAHLLQPKLHPTSKVLTLILWR
jgi:hypothetical protein